MERLRRYLAQKLRLVDLPANEQNDESQQSVLRNLSLDGIVEYIKENANCKIITMAGAGISTCKYISILYSTYKFFSNRFIRNYFITLLYFNYFLVVLYLIKYTYSFDYESHNLLVFIFQLKSINM